MVFNGTLDGIGPYKTSVRFLCITAFVGNGSFLGALHPRRRDGLLGTGTEWEGDDRVKARLAETARKRRERPWTAARTMEVLRRCPLAIAQRLVHCAIAVSTAVLGQSHKDNVRCTAIDEQLGQLKAKAVQLS